jgi:Transposase DDE domain
MRHSQSTLKASTVHAYAQHLLISELELSRYKPALPAAVVVSLLLLASLWQTSLSAACSLVKDAPSRETARRAAQALLPARPRDLLARVLAALRQTLPQQLRRLPVVMALDLHQRPFHGKKGTKGSTRRKKKGGTHNSFTYATLAVLTRWGRFTVGLVPTRPRMRLTTIVRELLKQAEEAGLSIAWLLLDKEFYAAEVVDLLQRANVAFLMPAEKKAATRRLYEQATPVGFYDYSWTADLRRYDPKAKKRRSKGKLTVRVRGCVARHPKKKGELLVYATWGLVGWSPQQVASEYRRRFGIEASYRQLGQCLARTSSRCERYRLLLVGIALLLCNLWSELHSEVFSCGPLSETRLELARMRLMQLRASVAAAIAAALGGYLSEWRTQRPLPLRFTHILDPCNY